MPQIGLWHFRVHYGTSSVNDIVDFIKARAEVVIIVKEIDANRPHIHSVITEFKQTKSTFVQQFLVEFPQLAGNGSYSCVIKKDLEAQIRYCCKGQSKETNPDVLHSLVDWKEYHSKFWEENSLLKAKSNEVNTGCQNDPSSLSKGKSKTPTWTEKVFQEMKVLYPEHIIAIQTFQLLYNPTEFERKTERDSRFILYNYMKKRLGPKKQNEFIIRDLFNGFISGFIQESGEASDKFNLKEFNKIYPV